MFVCGIIASFLGRPEFGFVFFLGLPPLFTIGVVFGDNNCGDIIALLSIGSAC
jgi:hypothetical protein